MELGMIGLGVWAENGATATQGGHRVVAYDPNEKAVALPQVKGPPQPPLSQTL